MKQTILFTAPIYTRSGYGDHARDLAYSIIDTLSEDYNLMILPTNWGSTPWTGLDTSTRKGKMIEDCIVSIPPPDQPEVYMQLTIPNEFQPIGKFNIGVTAGIETDLCAPDWIEGCNRMDMVITTSTHSLTVFQESKFDAHDKITNVFTHTLQLKPTLKTEVLFEGYDPGIFNSENSIDTPIGTFLKDIPETFCFLFVGQWLNGNLGHDRKDVGMLIHTFLEAFHNKPASTRPALILKTSAGNAGIMDRNYIESKIQAICEAVSQSTSLTSLPNIYLLHGEISDDEMNYLYNHPKVKAMISFTKGEGFGRPFLEFATTDKPLLVSNWSGQTDFLSEVHTVYLPGKLENVHSSAANNWLLPEAKWFTVDYSYARNILKSVFDRYKDYKKLSTGQKKYVAQKYTLQHMGIKLKDIFSRISPQREAPVLQLPKLNKL